MDTICNRWQQLCSQGTLWRISRGYALCSWVVASCNAEEYLRYDVSAQVCLTHVDACTAEPAVRAMKNLVSCACIEREFRDDVRVWTVAGMRQFDMYRLISDRVKPLQLGPPGRQKVSGSVPIFITWVNASQEVHVHCVRRRGLFPRVLVSLLLVAFAGHAEHTDVPRVNTLFGGLFALRRLGPCNGEH